MAPRSSGRGWYRFSGERQQNSDRGTLSDRALYLYASAALGDYSLDRCQPESGAEPDILKSRIIAEEVARAQRRKIGEVAEELLRAAESLNLKTPAK